MSRFALALVVLSGCVTTGLNHAWVPDEVLALDERAWPDDAAVVLFRADRTLLDTESASHSFTRRSRHEVIAIRGEGGFGLAEVRVNFRGDEQLLEFRARMIQPDGSRRELDARSFLSDVTDEGDERSLNGHYFRFPDVRVGSVLEYTWVIESPWILRAGDQDTLGRFPVRRYDFELRASKALVIETIEHNARAPIAVRTSPEGDHVMTFSLEDLPARRADDWAPHWTFTEPRWAWRLVAWRQRGLSRDVLRGWSDVVEARGEDFYAKPALLARVDLSLDVASCADVRCKVTRALARARADNVCSARWNRQAPLKEALASRQTSLTERAVLLRALLEKAGVDAWLAYGTDRASQQTAQTFPRLEDFNHLFVYLPVQPGLDAALALDPWCEYCAPDELTTRHRGSSVYVFKTRQVLGGVQTEGHWATLWSEPAQAPRMTVTHRAVVLADGTVDDAVEVSAEGSAGQRLALARRDWTQRRLEEEARRTAASVSFGAQVSNVVATPCSPTAGRCGSRSRRRIPTAAVLDGARLLVPLTVLEPLADTLLDHAVRDRAQDIHFTFDDDTTREVLDLTVPEGLELASAVPAPVSVKTDALELTVVVEKTAQGARVTRELTRRLGQYSRARYAEFKAIADAFRDVRSSLLVFHRQSPSAPHR